MSCLDKVHWLVLVPHRHEGAPTPRVNQTGCLKLEVVAHLHVSKQRVQHKDSLAKLKFLLSRSCRMEFKIRISSRKVTGFVVIARK